MSIPKEVGRVLISFIFAFLFISLFSSSTSWMYDNVEYLDADVFSVVGKYWAQGYLPYIDLWDQKGPIIFFVNAIGYGLTNSRIGVFLVQVISLTVTFFYTIKLLNNAFNSRVLLFFLLVSALGLLNDYGTAGNNVEEYLLPLLTMSFYYMYKWVHELQSKSQNHHLHYAFVYGMAFGVSAFTRLTNAIGLCGGILVIFVLLLYRRQWSNVLLNIASFFVGVGCIVLPFIAYFYWHGGLDEMLYGTFIYNFEYAKTAPKLDPFSLNQTLYLYKSAFSCLLLLMVSLFLIKFREKREIGFLWLSTSFFSLLWLMTGNGFHHYFIITYPFLSISLNEIYLSYKEKIIHKPLLYAFNWGTCLFLVFACSYEIYGAIHKMMGKNSNLVFYNEVKSDIPKQELDSFVAYNVSPYIYLYLDVKPCCRFFAYQDPQISFSHSLREKILQEYGSKKAKWVLVGYDSPNIGKLLNEEYLLKKSYKTGMKLFQHK